MFGYLATVVRVSSSLVDFCLRAVSFTNLIIAGYSVSSFKQKCSVSFATRLDQSSERSLSCRSLLKIKDKIANVCIRSVNERANDFTAHSRKCLVKFVVKRVEM